MERRRSLINEMQCREIDSFQSDFGERDTIGKIEMHATRGHVQLSLHKYHIDACIRY